MFRFLLRAAVPIVAAALLDRYVIRRGARRIKKETKAEINRWEAEGGPPADALPATASASGS